MKRFAVFLLVPIFVIAGSLAAQKKSDPVQVDLATTIITPIDLPRVDTSLDSAELRKFKIKISASKILQGLAAACICVAKIAGAKTSKEKQECACDVASSVFQLAANACEEHKRHKQNKKEQNQQAAKPDEQDEQCESEATQDNEKTEDPETKAINFEYLEQIQDLNTDQDKINFINAILQNKETTEVLLTELNDATKLLLIEVLFEN